MPIPSPFHERTAALCSSFRWKEWAGFLAVCSYEPGHELEYHAFRHAAGLLDVSPLYKYRVAGADAASFLAYVVTRDIRKLREGARYLHLSLRSSWSRHRRRHRHVPRGR